MIENTFLHIKGISSKTEEEFWKKGFCTWDDFIAKAENTNRNHNIKIEILKSKNALKEKDYSYFLTKLPKSQRWRYLEYFKNKVAYIDIETAGFRGKGNHITTIALYDGEEIKYYVYGQNLNDFKKDINDYDLIVTYNGDLFDIPFIEEYFQIKLRQFHIDLRWVYANLGYKGGLKGVEKSLGISRNELDGVNGYFAVLLWREYIRRGNLKALDTLISYNIEDAVNLEYLAYKAYNIYLENLYLNKNLLEIPPRPYYEMNVDEDLILSIRNYINSR